MMATTEDSVRFGDKASPLPAYPSLMIRSELSEKPSITDITNSALGRELHGIMAWFYGTGSARRQWPEASTGPGTNWPDQPIALAGYDRRAMIFALGQYGFQPTAQELSQLWPDLSRIAVVGVLEGTPAKVNLTLMPFHAEVEDQVRETYIHGWRLVLASGSTVFQAFYDPEHRLIWRDGDRGPSTRVWRVPALDEVTIDRVSLDADLVVAPLPLPPMTRRWWQEQPPRWTKRHDDWLAQAKRQGTLVLPERSESVPDRLFRLWRARCDEQDRPYSLLRRSPRKVSEWLYEADPCDLDRFAVSQSALDAAHEYFVQHVCPEFPARYRWHVSWGPYISSISIPTITALTHIPQLIAILTSGREAKASDR